MNTGSDILLSAIQTVVEKALKYNNTLFILPVSARKESLKFVSVVLHLWKAFQEPKISAGTQKKPLFGFRKEETPMFCLFKVFPIKVS